MYTDVCVFVCVAAYVFSRSSHQVSLVSIGCERKSRVCKASTAGTDPCVFVCVLPRVCFHARVSTYERVKLLPCHSGLTAQFEPYSEAVKEIFREKQERE